MDKYDTTKLQSGELSFEVDSVEYPSFKIFAEGVTPEVLKEFQAKLGK